MTYSSNRSNRSNSEIIPPHGGYRQLLSYQTTVIIYDLTVIFTKRHIDPKSRTRDQMDQAARSSKQNIAEASQASGTSKKTELKLVGVARASLEELLQDYEDYLRQHNLMLWTKSDPRILTIRNLSYQSDRSYSTYSSYTSNPESFVNCLITLINQANYLLDRQIQALEKEFMENGGITERLYQKRQEYRQSAPRRN
ncbi:four helix bundle protein [Candidatus Amesbacteria bacterium]|nr:four helix bundle protein [Candidatus Amesbacteria bacterium]MBI2587510.1 four helix bundle protein [Candidatus Amesbacteria bacterium]